MRIYKLRMDDEGGRADPLILQRRAEIKDAYARLLTEHPALPSEIRDFQVQVQVQVLSSEAGNLSRNHHADHQIV